MRVISTFAHGILDYIAGVALIFAPNIFGFSSLEGAVVWIPRILGAAVILQALLTDYELGVARIIPMRTHLMTDYVASAFLAISPWLFGFSNGPWNQWVPHLVVGLALLGVSLATEEVPRTAGGDFTVHRGGGPAARDAERKVGNY